MGAALGTDAARVRSFDAPIAASSTSPAAASAAAAPRVHQE